MQHAGKYHGGLIFFGSDVLDLGKATQIVAEVVAAFCHHVDRRSVLTGGRGRVTCSDWVVKLASRAVEPLSDSMQRRARLDAVGHLTSNGAREWPTHQLVITFCAADPDQADEDHALRLLAETLRRLVLASDPRFVEWRSSDRLVPADKFAPAMAQLSLPVCTGASNVRSRFGPVDRDAQRLSGRYDEFLGAGRQMRRTFLNEPDPETVLTRALQPPLPVETPLVHRLATWSLTGVIATLSGPVGLSVAAVNVLRGEDMRLNTHVLALAGAIAMLSSSGALANVMSVLPVYPELFISLIRFHPDVKDWPC